MARKLISWDTEADAGSRLPSPVKTEITTYFEIPAELTDLDTTVTGEQLDAIKTKSDTITAGAQPTDTATVDAAGAVMNTDTTTAAMSFVIDEDDMATNSATKVPTQQSVKAYVDTFGGGSGGGEVSLAGGYATTFGNGADTTHVITHGLGTDDVVVQLREVATGEVVWCDITVVDDDTVSLEFDEAPATDSLRVLVVSTEVDATAISDAIDADLAARSISFTDDGEGTGHFNVGGVPISGTLEPLWVAQSLAALHTTFSDKDDGDPPDFGDEGVPVTLRGGALENIRLTVRDGLLQAPDSSGAPGDRGHYWNQPLVGARRIGCTFKIAEGVDPFGAAVLVFWEDEIPTPYYVPNSPFHLSVHSDGWELGVFEGGNYTDTHATIDVIGGGTFDTPLVDDWDPEVAGSGTLHRMEAVIVGETVTIALPDGSVAMVTDPRVASIPANVACHEIYHHTADAAFTAFETIWASTDEGPVGAASMGEVARIASKLSNAAADGRPMMARYAPATPANITVPSAYAAVTGLPTIEFTLPPDCTAFEVEATLYYEITAAAKILVAFSSGATKYDPQVIADMSSFKGALTYRGFRTGMTAGTGGVYTLEHRVVTGSGAVLKLDSPNGYVASWKITPINVSG